MPRSKRQSEQMRRKSRQALLQAARTTFAERGYFQSKIADIAQAAGMSQGNVYWYFSSKEALLKAVLQDGVESLGELFERVATLDLTSDQKLDLLLKEYSAFARERGEFVNIFLSLLAHGGEPLMQDLGFDTPRIGQHYHQAISTIFLQAKQEGLLQEDPDPQILTMFYFGLFNGLMITYGQGWLEISPKTLRAAVPRLLGFPSEPKDQAVE